MSRQGAHSWHAKSLVNALTSQQMLAAGMSWHGCGRTLKTCLCVHAAGIDCHGWHGLARLAWAGKASMDYHRRHGRGIVTARRARGLEMGKEGGRGAPLRSSGLPHAGRLGLRTFKLTPRVF